MKNEIALLTNEIISCICSHITENTKGFKTINGEYWAGRLFESEDIKREIIDVIEKYI